MPIFGDVGRKFALKLARASSKKNVNDEEELFDANRRGISLNLGGHVAHFQDGDWRTGNLYKYI